MCSLTKGLYSNRQGHIPVTNYAYFNLAPDANSLTSQNEAFLNVYREVQEGSVKSQKVAVLDYCNHKKITPVKFVEDGVSHKTSWRERTLGKILEKAVAGDVLVVAEPSCLAISAMQVLEILELATQKELIIHFAKDQMVMDGSSDNKVKKNLLELILKIEHEFISKRTKEALIQHKKLGHLLGRPKGEAKLLKLDAYQDDILAYLKKGINKRAIAKLIQCSPSTLYQWLKRRSFL
jgi:DNA invertase Pin-like site-specific DNA recombinase